MSNHKQKEQLISKLVETKRKPKVIIKIDKTTGEKIEYFYTSFIFNSKQQQITSKSLSNFIEKIDSVLFQLSNPEVLENAKQPLPLKDAFNIYLTEIRLPKLKEYSEEHRQRNYKIDYSLVQLIYRFLKNKVEYFHQIDDNAIQGFKYHCIHEKNNSETTFHRKLIVLRSLQKHISTHTQYVEAACNFAIFEKPKKRDMTHYLTPNQIDVLLSVASPLHQSLIKFFIYTGLRKQNGFDLKWSEIDFENRQITVMVKQNKIHTVPIIKPLLTILLSIKEEQEMLYGALKEYVFLYNGGRLKNAYLSMKNLFKKADITLPHGQLFHVLRHTCAVTLINNGVDLYTVQKILGHSGIQMTQRYARLQTNTIAKEMERECLAIESIVFSKSIKKTIHTYGKN